ncbi:MAG: TIGR01459 family HAD-type hydrolase [Pseudolabrys sp.]
MPNLTPHFAGLASAYDIFLCDVWGVVHNGEVSFPDACEALMRVRAQGKVVVFITNAPRPGEAVIRQIDHLHVPHEAYDSIVSSGDVTRDVIMHRKGQTICHIGPERDHSIFKGQNATFAPLESADYIVCSGLYDDEVEKPEDYRARLEIALKRKLFMVCGNPDLVVERGTRLIYCAGSIADLYATMGGEVLYAGKPYRPIYDLALAKAETALGRKVDMTRVMAIGDSVRTDLKGARAFGIDMLFIAAGIHAEEFGGRDTPRADAMKTVFAAAGEEPTAVMKQLLW